MLDIRRWASGAEGGLGAQGEPRGAEGGQEKRGGPRRAEGAWRAEILFCNFLNLLFLTSFIFLYSYLLFICLVFIIFLSSYLLSFNGLGRQGCLGRPGKARGQEKLGGFGGLRKTFHMSIIVPIANRLSS